MPSDSSDGDSDGAELTEALLTESTDARWRSRDSVASSVRVARASTGSAEPQVTTADGNRSTRSDQPTPTAAAAATAVVVVAAAAVEAVAVVAAAAAAAAAPPPERPRQQRRQRAPRSTTQAEQRIIINFYFWNVLDAPPEEEWGKRDGAIAHCVRALNLPHGSSKVVKEVFRKTSEAALAGDVYDPATTKNVGGLAKVLIAVDSPEAQIAADELEDGGSRKSATEKVNEYRLKHDLGHVGGFNDRGLSRHDT